MCEREAERMHVCCLIVGLPTCSSCIVSAAKAVLTFCKQKKKHRTASLSLAHMHVYIYTNTYTRSSFLSFTPFLTHPRQQHVAYVLPGKNRPGKGGVRKERERAVADQSREDEQWEVNKMKLLQMKMGK